MVPYKIRFHNQKTGKIESVQEENKESDNLQRHHDLSVNQVYSCKFFEN